MLQALVRLCRRRRVMYSKDDAAACARSGHRLDFVALTRKGRWNIELKTYSPFSKKWEKAAKKPCMKEEAREIIQHYNNVVNGVQKGKDNYNPKDYFQNLLKYFTISVFGGINWKNWMNFVHAVVPKPEEDFYTSIV